MVRKATENFSTVFVQQRLHGDVGVRSTHYSGMTSWSGACSNIVCCSSARAGAGAGVGGGGGGGQGREGFGCWWVGYLEF